MRIRTLDEVAAPYLHYPTAIQTALLRLETHPTFRTLPRSAIPVLKALVTRVSATNGCTAFRAKLCKVADEACVSYKTVQRMMRACIQLGWVESVGERRSEMGNFITPWYRFTEGFCALVLLPHRNAAAQHDEDDPRPESELSDGAIYVDLSLKKEYRETSIKHRGENPIKLPAPVEHIPSETEIRPSGICKLLGLAARAGHKLEHVYMVAKPYLQRAGAKRSRAFSYLRRMLDAGKQVDYASRAAQIQRAEDPKVLKLAEVMRTCRYKRYVHPTQGLRIRVYDGMAEVTDRDGTTTTYVGRQMDGIYKGVATGNLVEVLE